MNKDKASLVGEDTLWSLYRKLLGARLLHQHVQATSPRKPRNAEPPSIAIAAALAETLVAGDTLGLAGNDAATRYLCGMPLRALREASETAQSTRSAKRRNDTPAWALDADPHHGMLPGTGPQQANLAAGAALATRLHASESLVVLVRRSPPLRRDNTGEALAARMPDWADASALAVALRLPLLFVTDSSVGPAQQAANPKRPAPDLPAIPVDRADALALYRVLYESAARARTGGGPTWIDARAWQAGPTRSHAAGDAATEGQQAVTLLEDALRSRGLSDQARLRHLQRGLAREFVQAGWSGLVSA